MIVSHYLFLLLLFHATWISKRHRDILDIEFYCVLTKYFNISHNIFRI